MKRHALITFVSLILTSAAHAASISYSDLIALTTTNWSSSVTVPKFDPHIGILTSIEFKLVGRVEGGMEFESLDAAPATVTTSLTAEIKLMRPDLSLLLSVAPAVNNVDNVTAFDGVIDFGGTSGRSYASLVASQMAAGTSPPPASDLALFTGAGSITLPVTATGLSSATGAGNLLVSFNTAAAAEVMVTYHYIPEPATLTALASAGGWVVSRRRRR